ncbi:MAG: MFS transporter, partial [Gammaproteobacteria bacterium]
MTHFKNNHISTSDENHLQRATIVALISCLSIYGVTISLFTPLLSLLLEQRGTSSTAIGVLAMSAPTGVLIGSFLMPRLMRAFEGRNLLVGGVLVEILLIGALMATDSFAGWMLIRFLAGLTGTVLFIVSETWLVEIAPARSRGKIMGLYNTA